MHVVARCLQRWPDRPAHAFTVYESVRRPHTVSVQRAARRGETTFHLADWRAVWRRNHALRETQHHGTAASPTGWLYGYDALTEPLVGAGDAGEPAC